MKQSSFPKRTKAKVYATSEERSSARVNKVAESLVVYTPARRQTSHARRIAGILASNEVWRFAAQNDLTAHLETAVRLAKECFKKIDRFAFSYDIDPEIENESWINLHARIKGSFEELLQQDAAYTRAMVRTLPLDKQSLIRFFSSVECKG
ncbi:hypothetical protein HUU05_01640 [candidate division KSB1 bacterium]|nr:hypothetical protein [candidate division KSB1 bacterium]